jgi:hypothetical protein
MERPAFARFFTLEEAQALLAEIEPLVAEMKETFALVRREIADAARSSGMSLGNPRLSQQLEKRGIASPLVEQINDLIRRVHEKGCVVNGPEAGLVDFPALLDSEIVFLCWQHGEPRISHWHRIPDGFAGRKPLLALEVGADPDATIH